ncbi:MAG: hypothetical protein NG737_02905 [Omnitrophica bacterium]|nr:hypothetical protein [Candidatus Omnitrophota bacterium]
MKNFQVMRILGILIVGLVFTANAYADKRSYVWTYEYLTMPKGMMELEYYFTTKVPDGSRLNTNTMQHQIELEYGITNRWDVAIYQRFKQTNRSKGSGIRYDGFKLRTRYRIGEKGDYLLDPLLYFEYIRGEDFSKPDVLEGKLILAKDIGNFNFAYNQIIKQEAEHGGLTENEYAFAAGYRVSPQFGFGIESKGNYTEDKYYLGPTVSFSKGKMWFALGCAFALNRESDDIQTRLIVGRFF